MPFSVTNSALSKPSGSSTSISASPSRRLMAANFALRTL